VKPKGFGVKSTKRIRREPSEAKLLILKTAEKIMLEEGYAAASVRRVAKLAGVSSTLLHYYYPTADDLLVALYRHTSEKDLRSLKSALSAGDPLAALWAYQTDSTRTALGVEFLALANHRKSIRIEIVEFAQNARALQAKALSSLYRSTLYRSTGLDAEGCSPLCLSMLLTSVSRNLIFESGVGISSGHAEARAYVERKLSALKRKHKRKLQEALRR
jgi:TetR/AcrR family transcriptional regulator, regulator of autoinduction and epiphytic fitness